jgi:hypothetical protein
MSFLLLSADRQGFFNKQNPTPKNRDSQNRSFPVESLAEPATESLNIDKLGIFTT